MSELTLRTILIPSHHYAVNAKRSMYEVIRMEMGYPFGDSKKHLKDFYQIYFGYFTFYLIFLKDSLF
jgi:hypothetical protein